MITVMGEATSVVCDLRPQKEVAHGTSERGWYERSYHSLPRSDLILWMCKSAARVEDRSLCSFFPEGGAGWGASNPKREFPLPTHVCFQKPSMLGFDFNRLDCFSRKSAIVFQDFKDAGFEVRARNVVRIRVHASGFEKLLGHGCLSRLRLQIISKKNEKT